MSKNKLLIDGKKIIIQECDSDRMRNKKFIKVVFLKNLAFKATEEDIRNFFAPRVISKLSYPKNPQSKKPMGFAYV